MKKKKNAALIASAALILALLTACTSETTTSQTTASSNNMSAAQSSAVSSAAPAAKDIYVIGDIADYNGSQVQVTKIEKSNGSQYNKPKDGNEFVIVTVYIKNTGSQNVDYNPLYFTIQNSQGQIANMTISLQNTDTALSTGDLTPGGIVSGTIVFEEPKDDKSLKLIYKSSIIDNKGINFDLMNSLDKFDALKGEQSSSPSASLIIGDVAKLGDTSLQVSEVKKSSGSTYDKPKDGYEYVIVSVNIKNTGKSNISYNPLYFSLKNSQGQIENMHITTVNTDTALSSGELAPGGVVSGTIAFEQIKDDPSLELIYKGNLLSSDSVSICVNKKQDSFTALK